MCKHFFFIFLLIFSSFAFSAQPKSKVVKGNTIDGLVRIDKDGAYIYDQDRALKNKASHLRLGNANQPKVEIKIGETVFKFEDFYVGTSAISLGYDYEYYFFTENGKFGGQLGVSLQVASGQGRLVQPAPAVPQPSIEKFTFLTLPVYFGGVYRFEYYDRQWIAPYVAGGGTYVALLEKREDKKSFNSTGGFGYYAAAGALFNLTYFDRETSLTLDNEYGIGNLWINLEYKVVNVEVETFSFKNSYLQGGFSFDF